MTRDTTGRCPARLAWSSSGSGSTPGRRIYALEPITGEERGSGRRTLVWIEGIAEPLVASRTQETILEEMGEPTEQPRRRPGARRAVVEHPQLFSEAEE